MKRWWHTLPVGTKSVLAGAHCLAIHPFFVAAAWTWLYGPPLDPRLWVAFFVHDTGYWGKRAMDDEEGERHVEWGASVMGRLFGQEWHDFALLHSRFYAKKLGRPFSRLCVADKLAVALEPWWLYLPRAHFSGEIHEYKDLAKARNAAGEGKYSTMNVYDASDREWFRSVQDYLRRWVAAHRGMRPDTWTPELKREGA